MAISTCRLALNSANRVAAVSVLLAPARSLLANRAERMPFARSSLRALSRTPPWLRQGRPRPAIPQVKLDQCQIPTQILGASYIAGLFKPTLCIRWLSFSVSNHGHFKDGFGIVWLQLEQLLEPAASPSKVLPAISRRARFSLAQLSVRCPTAAPFRTIAEPLTHCRTALAPYQASCKSGIGGVALDQTFGHRYPLFATARFADTK